MPLLDVRNLSVTYTHRGEQTLAVDNISFSVESGEIVAIVGESGSGKSSVALAVTKLLPESIALIRAKEIRFEGKDLSTASEKTLRGIRGGRISYVFQDPGTSLNPVLTIGSQLCEMIEHHTDKRGKAAEGLAIEWLARVGISASDSRLDAYPHEFSGGMQQRVMIAMAMLARPSLLIADEPTTALDVTVQVQILKLLRDFQRKFSLSVLLISHDLTVVERIAHRVIVMLKGEIVESGATTSVFGQPKHPYTKALLDSRLRPIQRPEGKIRG